MPLKIVEASKLVSTKTLLLKHKSEQIGTNRGIKQGTRIGTNRKENGEIRTNRNKSG